MELQADHDHGWLSDLLQLTEGHSNPELVRLKPCSPGLPGGLGVLC